MFSEVAEASATATQPVLQVIDNPSSQLVFGVPLTTKDPNTGVYTAAYPFFPPSQVSIVTGSIDQTTGNIAISKNNASTLAASAVQIEAQTLRAGGHLLHDLIRRDVYSDLASAAQQSAQQIDPTVGPQLAWGLNPTQPYYGTYAHAARVLLGRWEIGDSKQDFNNHGDPQCAGVKALDLLTRTFGSGLAARAADIPIRTPGEQTAAQLVERSGLVVPSCEITPAHADDLRKALLQQLLLQEEVDNKLTTAPTPTALSNVVQGIHDDEILFAFQRALNTWQLLTNTASAPAGGGGAPDGGVEGGTEGGTTEGGAGCAQPIAVPSGNPPMLPGGLPWNVALNPAAGPASAVNGIAVQGGLARSRLRTDPMARAGGLTEASQCPETNSEWSEWGLSTVDPAVEDVTTPTSLPSTVFQDAFNIGQALERDLNRLQGAVASFTDPNSDPGAVARGGIAELRSWAGNTIVHAFASGFNPDGTIPGFAVRVGGMSYANDFGITSPPYSAAAKAFGFVYGPPWVAECAAGVRADCPAKFAQTYVQVGSFLEDQTPPAGYDTMGVLDNVFEIYVPITPALSMVQPFQPNLNSPPSPQEAHLYMVRLQDPTSPGGHGHVLGTISLQGQWQNVCSGGTCRWMLVPSITGFVDAPMQRELVHAALDLGPWVGAKPPALGDLSAAQTSGYCVDGVPRDLFVPLDNELVSGNQTYENSWQAYLSLAQQAAQTADALGQQLIADDLQIAERQQAAEEQLANICGDFGSLSAATVQSNGTVSPGPTDQTTSACLAEPITDVVFLGQLPAGITTSGDQTCNIKAALNCSTTDLNTSKCQPSSSAPAQSPSPLCAKTTLTAAALSITGTAGTSAPSGSSQTLAGPPSPLSDACSSIVQAAGTLHTGFAGLAFIKALGDPGLGTSALQTVATQLKMTVDPSNHWQVTLGGGTIMDSDSDPTKNTLYWPGCISTGCKSAVDVAQTTMNRTWSLVFRSCGYTDPLGTALGCEGSADAELNMIKWRVMQAMWMIGASGGTVPQKMFTLPLPAAFTDCGPGGMSCSNAPGGYPTIYFANTNVADQLVVGTPLSVDPRFGAFGTGSAEIPTWYSTTYNANTVWPPTGTGVLSPPATLVHLVAANDPVGFTQCKNSFGNCSGSSTPVVQVPLLTLMTRSSSTLDGYKCAQNTGNWGNTIPQDTATGQPWFQTVGQVKSGVADVTACVPYCGNGGSQQTLNLGLDAVWDSSASANWTGSALPNSMGITASGWPPSARAAFYLGAAAPPDGTCGAMALLLQAAVLSCTPGPTGGSGGLNPTSPPAIHNLSDIQAFESWLGVASATVRTMAGGLYAQEIPTRVITDFQANTIGSGALGGTKGQAVLAMEQSIQSLPAGWAQIASDLSELQGAVNLTNGAITAADLQDDTTQGQLALDQLKVQASLAQAVAQFISTAAQAAGQSAQTLGASNGFIPVAAMELAQQVIIANAEVSQLDSLSVTADKTEQNQMTQALAQLAQTTQPIWADIQKQMDSIRAGVAQMDASGQSIVQAQNEAAYQVAIGTGQDFVEIAGQEVPIPVNTVLRRQASATEQRYQAALTNAKALAYMARRAIEQRIGITLESLTQHVGPLDPPAVWADDICSLQGVNFAALSSATPSTSGADGGIDGGSPDQQAINQFADAWVGDYVAKLQNFVTYYNTQYPSHQGDDTAVLSLRYDLLGPASQCTAPAPNLLENSGDLSRLTPTGWQLTNCGPATPRCLAVVGGYALVPPQDGPWGAEQTGSLPTMPQPAGTGITWLLDVSQTQGGSDAGVSSPDAGTGAVGVSNVVGQARQLAPGSYVLSWWDQARNSDGTILYAGNGTAVPYVAGVSAASTGAVVANFNQAPFTPQPPSDAGAATRWSGRNTLPFTVTTAGVYEITFAASTFASPTGGSVAIADVQLELSPNGQPSDYVATTDTTMVSALNCAMSDGDLRAGFTHNCDKSGTCWYDLNVPLIIDTTALAGAPVGTKLAQGNYNYRYLNSAVNLVGTNVHSCTNDPNPNCYGSAFVQYDLQHDARQAGILGYDGNARIFDFGIASINHGKALAAERYLTTPLSSNDQALISQPGIQHIEFGGRPLDGTYHLRIWDSPDLNWSALQDIQIIINYEYWSQIQVDGNTQKHSPPRLKRSPITPIIIRSLPR
jgi:hypothetical protein